MKNSSLLMAALEYAEAGLRLIPVNGITNGRCDCGWRDCESPGKHPLIKDWGSLASSTADQVRFWWTKWPNANIGMLIERGTVVLDVDMHDADGKEALKVFEAEHGVLPDTPTVLTGGGGLHYYFAGEGRTSKLPLKGIERLGIGSFIIMPPSNHFSGNRYEFADAMALIDLPMADVPSWLLNITRSAEGDRGHWKEGDVIPEGCRDDTIFRIGLRLLRQGLTAEQMVTELHRINRAYCEPPLPQSVIEQKAAQAEKYIPATTEEDDESFSRLAHLSKVEYDRARKREADSMGIRVATLDEEVDKRRPSLGNEDGKQGRKVELHEFEPWPTPVDGAELLDELASAIADYVVLPENGADTAALWIFHVFAFDCWEKSPRLGITSPEKRCGKSRMLDVLSHICPRAKRADSISSAAIYRIIEKYRPCLLIDEADTFLKENEELRGILNSSHARNGSVTRCVGDDHEPKDFSTWAPIVIASIRALPGTVADRSIILQLQRRTKSQPVKRFREKEARVRFERLGRMAARWFADNESLLEMDPEVPEALNDRAADNWLPLFSIANAVGGHWPEKAKRAALALSNQDVIESPSTTLLVDIKSIFVEPSNDRIFSQDLCDRLASMEERPWATWNKGKPLDQTRLSSLLRPYGIGSKNVRIGTEQRRGYELTQFESAFERYASEIDSLSPTLQDLAVPPSHRTEANNDELCRTSIAGTHEPLNHANTNSMCPTDLNADARQRTFTDENQVLGTPGRLDKENPRVQDNNAYLRRNENEGTEV